MSLNDWSAADVASRLSGSGKAKAKKTSRGWMVCCPAHEDRTPSLSLADGREGMLLYHCFGGCQPEDVRSALESELGVHTTAAPETSKKKRVIEKKEEIEVISPVPEGQEDQRPDDFYHFEHGMPSKVWTYRLPEGRVAGWVARYDLDNGSKEVIPWCWAIDKKKGKEELRMKAMPSPRPLYNLDQIIERVEDPILWNEGEKAADAAQKLFPGWVPTACQGGGNAIPLTDFSVLHGRLVILLCDHDGPGYTAASKIADMLMGHCDLYFLRWPEKREDGSLYEAQPKDDAADHLERGWTVDELRALAKKGVKLTIPIGEIAPAFDPIHYDRQSERRFQNA